MNSVFIFYDAQALHAALIILVMAAVTFGIRLAPFILFDHGQEPPQWIRTLGDLLPPACMSVLVVYCVRNVELFSGNHGIPDFLCIALAMILHAWKRNTLLSICVSTILYMVLVQTIF